MKHLIIKELGFLIHISICGISFYDINVFVGRHVTDKLSVKGLFCIVLFFVGRHVTHKLSVKEIYFALFYRDKPSNMHSQVR